MAQHESRATRGANREDILEPDLPIIDPHHHLWDRPGNRYLLDDYLADVRTGHNVRASVFVECGAFYRKAAPPLTAPAGRPEALTETMRSETERWRKVIKAAGITPEAIR